MRTIIAVFVLAATAAVACDVPVKSTVHAVTVFRDRAQVERTGTVKVPAGDNTVSFGGITKDLLDESVRVTGRGTADAAIVEVKVEPEYIEESAGAEIQERQASIDSLNEELRKLADRISVINTQRDFIMALKTPSAAPGVPRMPMKEFQEMMVYVGKELAELSDEIRGIDAKRAHLNDRIGALNKRMQDIRSQTSKTLKRVVVHIDSRDSGSLELTLTYVVRGASWRPLYDARVTTATGEIALTYFGEVRQETGENWDGVRVTLSTASPSQGTEIPELSAWYVQSAPIFGYARRAAVSPLSSSGADEIPDNALMPKPRPGSGAAGEVALMKMKDMDMSVEDQLLSTTFTIEAPLSIPSDGKPHKATISAPTLKATLEYVTVPRKLSEVFLRAKSVNSTTAPFLPGSVNVFVDKQFVATTSINTVVTGDSLQLALGTNDAVKSERRLVNKVQEYNGLLTKTFKWNYEYLTTVTNNAKTEITIDVMDQLPISQNEKIIIETKSITPSADQTSDANVQTWHWKLKPGEKKEIRTKYSIEYPRDMHVAGLE